MTIQLLARHFIYANFMEADYCPIAFAANELYPQQRALVAFTYAYINNVKYFFSEPYHLNHYDSDLKIAAENGYDNSIIREIKTYTHEHV